jgi:putative N-acetyltransferase (TIGR04045 family)
MHPAQSHTSSVGAGAPPTAAMHAPQAGMLDRLASPDLEEAAGAAATASCRVVADAAERELHLRIRLEVFVREQRLFDTSDHDAHDDDPRTLHVLGLWGRVAAGTVRLYPLGQPGVWNGDRLAVLGPFRKHGLGGPLVRFAVRTAGELGGSEMVAQIQLPNVAFFERLGWRRRGEPADYCDRPHQQMAIDLTAPAARSPAPG